MSLESTGGFRSRTPKKKQEAEEIPARRENRGKRNATSKGTARAHASQPSRGQNNERLGSQYRGIDRARVVSYEVLMRVEEDQAFANLVLPKLLTAEKLSGRDAAFATELTYGTLRHLGVLDVVLAECSSRDLATINPAVLTALRLGAYQLLYTRVDAHAAVDTSVRLVEAAGEGKAKGFANAILRTISRKKPEAWFEELTPAGEIPALAFKYAHPEWIVESFSKVIDSDQLAQALEADSERPKVHLVARPGEISAEELALISGGEEGKYSPYAVYLESGDPGKLDAVREGLAAVQDEGSQLIARAVVEAPVTGEDTGRWLDLCAGPGGKAALLGALAAIDGAHVDAVEVSEHRAKLIAKTVRNLPVSVYTADGRNPGLAPGYDRVLVDAPCSGLGALRRRPEARWRKKESDIAELNDLQLELLTSAIELARPGGIIVYSTCSPDIRETRGIVNTVLDDPRFALEELEAAEFVPNMTTTGPHKSVQMWPHIHGTDAMFFAVLKKN